MMNSKIALSAGHSNKALLTKSLLICGILSSVHYVAINVYVPLQWKEYSVVSQTISELSAIGAPTRVLWNSLCSFYSFLIIAFAWGILRSAGENNRLRLVAAFIAIYGATGFFWPPMHQRAILAAGGGNLTDTLHIAFTILTVVLMILSIVFGAAALGKNFRLYSAGTLIVLLIFGILTGLDGPRIAADQPTPWIGVWERINIAIFLLWVAVFAAILWKRESHVPGQRTPASRIKSAY